MNSKPLETAGHRLVRPSLQDLLLSRLSLIVVGALISLKRIALSFCGDDFMI